jgi:two-component system, NarL family, response regulator DevR
MIRVYVADGDPVVRRGIGEQVSAEPDMELAGAGDTRGLVPGAVAGVDVLVADVRLPDAAAVLACRRVRATHPRMRILLCTGYEDDEAVLTALVTGATGCVLKQIRGDGLMRAVREVALGATLLDPRITAHVLQRLRRYPHAPVLTDAEYALLEAAALGLSDAQIARTLDRDIVGVAKRFAGVATRIVALRADAVGFPSADGRWTERVRQPGAAPPARPAATLPTGSGGQGRPN